GDTSSQLASIEGNLSSQVGTLRSALDAAAQETGQSHALLTDQVKTLRDVSTYVLRDIAAMASQFNTHADALAVVAAQLSETNTRMDANLDERRGSLEAIASGLSAQAEAVENRLGQLTSLLTQTLDTAEERITGIANTVR